MPFLPGPSTGGSLPGKPALQERSEAVVTTAQLPSNGSVEINIPLDDEVLAYRLYLIEVDKPARVRAYATPEHRTADFGRASGVDPAPVDHGVMLEFIATESRLGQRLVPMVDGFIDEAGEGIPLTITNTSISAEAVTVTLTYLRTE